MTNTIEQVIAYAAAHPKRDGGSWSAWCESFVSRAGGFSWFPTALAAGNASGWLNPDWRTAPRGAIHYWGGVYIKGVECGHVCFELGGGTLLMASSRVSNYGTGLGTIHFTNYGLPKYRGWSLRHGSQTLAASSTAGTSKPLPIPAPLPIGQLKTMFLVWTTDRPDLPASTCWLLSPEGFKEITDTTSAQLKLWRRIGIPELDSAKPILLGELDILAEFLRHHVRGYVAPAAGSATIVTTASAEAVAAAVESLLADDFAAVKGAIPKAFTITATV